MPPRRKSTTAPGARRERPARRREEGFCHPPRPLHLEIIEGRAAPAPPARRSGGRLGRTTRPRSSSPLGLSPAPRSALRPGCARTWRCVLAAGSGGPLRRRQPCTVVLLRADPSPVPPPRTVAPRARRWRCPHNAAVQWAGWVAARPPRSPRVPGTPAAATEAARGSPVAAGRALARRGLRRPSQRPIRPGERTMLRAPDPRDARTRNVPETPPCKPYAGARRLRRPASSPARRPARKRPREPPARPRRDRPLSRSAAE